MIEVVLIMIFAYLLGSIPFSFILGKMLQGIDLRKYGSGNVGATNALRVLGWKTGVAALLLDMLKGFGAVILARVIIPDNNLILITAGFIAILGHMFTVFLRFKGGKGVATSAGVFAALIPVTFIITLLFFILLIAITRYVSLGSLTAALVLVLTQGYFTFRDGVRDPEFLVLALIVSLFIFIKHRTNIKRLWEGTENKISFRRKKK